MSTETITYEGDDIIIEEMPQGCVLTQVSHTGRGITIASTQDAEEIEVETKESDTMSKVTGGDSAYLQLLEDMKQLHIRKNAGYSGDSQDRWANFRLSETFGISSFLGVMVRMSDKWIRITNLIKNPSFDQVGESIDDTLFDLAAYALIAICIRREKKEK